MTTSNWQPAEANILTVTWNQEGTVIDAGDSVAATITLTVPDDVQTLADVSTDFNFDIIITGTE